MPNPDVSIFITLVLVEKAHRGQMYNDYPYLVHLLRVPFLSKDDLTYQTVALLHDIVEDTDWTVDDVRQTWGDTVADAVDALTRREGEVYLDEYIPRVAENIVAWDVKIGDLLDNVHHADEAHASLVPRYKKAMEFLIF